MGAKDNHKKSPVFQKPQYQELKKGKIEEKKHEYNNSREFPTAKVSKFKKPIKHPTQWMEIDALQGTTF